MTLSERQLARAAKFKVTDLFLVGFNSRSHLRFFQFSFFVFLFFFGPSRFVAPGPDGKVAETDANVETGAVCQSVVGPERGGLALVLNVKGRIFRREAPRYLELAVCARQGCCNLAQT